MIHCNLTTCYGIESACFQRLKAKCDELLSSFAFNFKLRRYSTALPQALTVQVADAAGFVFAGARNTVLTVPPWWGAAS